MNVFCPRQEELTRLQGSMERMHISRMGLRRVSQLPPELTDQILDHLWNDRLTLKLCSLTCRAWLPTTRFHLFDSIRIRSTSECRRFKRLLDVSSPLPKVDLTYYIRAMIFQDLPFRGVNALEFGYSFSRLRKVKHLQLCFWPAEALADDLIYALQIGFPDITFLDLEQMMFANLNDLEDLISGFPKLSRLRMNDFVVYRLVSTYLPFHPAPIPEEWTRRERAIEPVKGDHSIKDLDVHLSIHIIRVTLRLREEPFNLRLHTLRLTWPLSTDNLHLLSDFFKVVGSSLGIFQFSVMAASDVDGAYAGLPEAIDHLQMAKLKTLDIGPVLLSPLVLTSPTQLTWIPYLLSRAQTHARKLETIRFYFALSQSRELDRFDWTAVDQVLGSIARKWPTIQLIFTVLSEDISPVDAGSRAKKIIASLVRRFPMSRPKRKQGGAIIDAQGRAMVHLLTTFSRVRA